jgi:hypothetical protein
MSATYRPINEQNDLQESNLPSRGLDDRTGFQGLPDSLCPLRCAQLSAGRSRSFISGRLRWAELRAEVRHIDRLYLTPLASHGRVEPFVLEQLAAASRTAKQPHGPSGLRPSRSGRHHGFPPPQRKTPLWSQPASARDPSLQPRPWLYPPGPPSKRASVAVWAVSGGRRRLRKPHRRASGSSSARAHEAAQKPPAHRSSGVP